MGTVNFVLDDFNNSLTAVTATLESNEFTLGDHDATAILDVSISDISGVFKFISDSKELSDASETDLKYFVEADRLKSLNLGNVFTLYDVSENSMKETADDQTIPLDFIRYLAFQLFNSVEAVDLFDNEDAFKNHLENEETDTTVPNINDVINDSGTDAAPLNNDSEGNLTKKMLDQVVNFQKGRLQSLSPEEVGDKYHFTVPIEVGDALVFLLTVKPATDQETVTGKTDPIAKRVYRMKINVVAD